MTNRSAGTTIASVDERLRPIRIISLPRLAGERSIRRSATGIRSSGAT